MPNLALQSFLAAQFAGSQLNAELQNRQEDAEIKKQQVMQYKQQSQMQQQQQEQQKAQTAALSKLVNDYDTDLHATQTSTGASPDAQKDQQYEKESAFYKNLGKSFLVSDPARAQSYYKLADDTMTKKAALDKSSLEISEKKAKDVASYAGAVLDGSQDSQQAFAWVKANIGLKDALAIPTDPQEYKNFWKAKQTAGVSAESQLSNARQIAEDVQRDKDRKDAAQDRRDMHVDSERDKAAQRDLIRSGQQAAAEERASRRAEAKDKSDFAQTEKLNSKVQAEAKPFIGDLERVNHIQGLLKVDSSAADQQIHQSLVAVLGDFKGRATNQFYKDNKNFGDVVDKAEGFLSRAFTGRYSENDRVAIGKMMSDMKSKTIEPALAKLESDQKAHAKGYGLDPDQVAIQGDFNRNAKASKYSEGQVATSPDGRKAVYTNGKWVIQ